MQIIISPAKLMTFADKTETVPTTEALFPQQTKQLVTNCQKLSAADIADKMQINPSMAANVFEQFQTFYFDNTPTRAAAFAYNGIAYKGLNIHDFDADDLEFAQQHLNIISGLYGLLRPLDAIRPYRLEMKRDIVPEPYKKLRQFWQQQIGGYLSERTANDDNVILNVASKEYSDAVVPFMTPLGVRVIQTSFLQHEAGQLKQITVHTKKARGLLARYVIKNRVRSIDEVKSFNYEDYSFYPSMSENDSLVFVR